MNWNYSRILAVAVILFAIPQLFFAPGMSYFSRVFILMALYAILTVGLNIVFGHTDQLLLFTGAITGVGTYTTVLVAQGYGISPWITLFLGASVAGVIGAIVCYVAAIRELTVIVISILTLALQFSIIELINSLRDITGGVTGLSFSGLRLEAIENALGLREEVVLFYTISVILLAVLLLYRYLMHSKYGLAFEMIRQDETAAESAGLDVVKYKTFAGFVATFIMGLTGPFFGQLSGYITPNLFSFNSIDVLILIMLIVGGLRTTYGPLVGAALIIFLNEELRSFAEYRSILLGTLLIVLFLYFRDGIVPFVDERLEKWNLRQRVAKRMANFRPGS
ncbi:branched-chain amino acid ABC transporter permease [Haladaptatus sp. DYF46]|uniref:branched-chain amino acid ABC transporter permease n=1 Tax=Haladaptatus sp. DYF46 TaxID=2886041 RepID=UPI001E552583|nr:branched-chain amino acid ABC transporter permease [Haladaptatus sp. DYF46]